MYKSESEFQPGQSNTLSRVTGRAELSCALKRAIDIVGALCFLVLFCWLFWALWVAVAVTTGVPSLYRHERVGKGGKRFGCIKFRSMVRNADVVLSEFLDSTPSARAEWEREFKLRNDPRVTSFGKFLRATCLDELPQFWNVLKGDMSLVGPRPVTEAELLTYYGSAAAEYKKVRPGITGLWQVDGRGDVTYAQRVAMDVRYVHEWTNWGDLVVLFKTARVVFARKGSY